MATTLFLLYILFMTIWIDCKVRSRLRKWRKNQLQRQKREMAKIHIVNDEQKELDDTIQPKRSNIKTREEQEEEDAEEDEAQQSFLTLNVRYQLALTIPLYVFNFHGIARVVYKPPTGDKSATCQYFASNGQLLTWVMYMYMLMLSFWLLVYITCGRAMRRLHKVMKLAFEIGSHVIVWVVSLIFFVVPFFVDNGGSIYGEAGEVCWISSKTQLGKVVGMATFYVRFIQLVVF